MAPLKVIGIDIPNERLRWVKDQNLPRMEAEHGYIPVKGHPKQGDMTLCAKPEPKSKEKPKSKEAKK